VTGKNETAPTDDRIRLGLLAASPMYYQAPLYRLLAAEPSLDFTAIFASNGGLRRHDAGYGQPVVWDVDLLTGYRSEFLDRADQNPIQGGFFSLRDPDVVSRVFRARYDVLWIHGYNFLSWQLAAATQLSRRRPLLVREEQTLLHSRSAWRTAVKSVWLRALFGKAFGLYIGSQNARWFRRWGMPRSRMFFVPYCVDNEKLRAEASELRRQKQDLQRSFGIKPGSGPVFLMVGRLIPKKNPLGLVEAFARLRKDLECNLLLVGSGELESAVNNAVRERQIPDVHLAGFINQSQIARAYAAADIFVLASIEHETWGVVVNEAMNFDLPILASRMVGCAEDLVVDGKNGFVFEPNSVDELSFRMRQFVESATLRQTFGAQSGAMIQAWNYEAAAKGVLGATAAAVGDKRWQEATSATGDVTGSG